MRMKFLPSLHRRTAPSLVNPFAAVFQLVENAFRINIFTELQEFRISCLGEVVAFAERPEEVPASS